LPPAAINLQIELTPGAPAALNALLRKYLDLARLVDLSRGERFSDAELERLIGAAPSQAAALLATEGHFRPRIGVQRLAPDEATAGRPQAPVRIRLEVDPGPRARVASVDLGVEGPLQAAASAGDPQGRQTLDLVRARWSLPVGAEFRNDAWNEAKSEVLVALRAAGYANARWELTRAEVEASRAAINLSLKADAGPLFRTGALHIDGVKLHSAEAVRNLAGFVPGSPATESLLLDFQDRLLKSGLFERVTVTLDPADTAAAATDPARAGAATVRVEVSESSRHELTLGLGVSANTGGRVSAEHVDRRAFQQALTLRNRAEWARSRQAWDGEISTHPGPSMARWLAGGTVERLQASSDDVLSQRLRVGRAQDSARIDRLTFLQVDRSVRRTAADRTSSVATTANQHWTWRQLDNPVLPTDGMTLALQGGAGQAWDSTGNRGSFGRAWSRVQWFRPVGRTWYAQARLEVGQVIAPGDLAVPDVLLFRAGGDDSVRGYAYRSLGPVVGSTVGSGKALATASVEAARPISKELPQFWGAAFVDAGRAADNFAQFKPAVGYGVGLRWRSPVGPLRLDIARGRETGANRLHFSLGIAF
jgi:translocation and assembly module TamA